jgi:hypothetical protein
MDERLKTATNIAVLIMAATWVAYVGYMVLRDRRQRPVDVLISTVSPPEGI